MSEDITCKIWATEVSPSGIRHRCHADAHYLAGQSYRKEYIETKLRETPTWGGTWKLIACEPNHDGKDCKSCPYRFYKGLSHYYDLSKQKDLLLDAIRRGADLKIV
ncbi:MAG: hypothetical protein HY363_06065 [Candidatus Aenigmarchaeota archaeon]|nr:hypothetical protein [Candidatus Aenigmarchaeota archaeon]